MQATSRGMVVGEQSDTTAYYELHPFDQEGFDLLLHLPRRDSASILGIVEELDSGGSDAARGWAALGRAILSWIQVEADDGQRYVESARAHAAAASPFFQAVLPHIEAAIHVLKEDHGSADALILESLELLPNLEDLRIRGNIVLMFGQDLQNRGVLDRPHRMYV